jgi:hypothetical protein
MLSLRRTCEAGASPSAECMLRVLPQPQCPTAVMVTPIGLAGHRRHARQGVCLVDARCLPQAEPASASAAPRARWGRSGTGSFAEDERAWARQGWSGTGYFVEDKESLGANPLRLLQQKKLLSAVEKAGLLSRAEKAGLTLSRVRPTLPHLTLHRLTLRRGEGRAAVARREGRAYAVACAPYPTPPNPTPPRCDGRGRRADRAMVGGSGHEAVQRSGPSKMRMPGRCAHCAAAMQRGPQPRA